MMKTYTRQRYVYRPYGLPHTIVYLASVEYPLEVRCYDQSEVRDRISYLLRDGFSASRIRVRQEQSYVVYPTKSQFRLAETTTRKNLLMVLYDRWEHRSVEG